MRAWGFLRSRAMVATLGALLVFGSGATVAVSQLTHHFTSTGQANTASAATDTATTSADATATATAGSGTGSGGDATATAGATATSIPPTPTTRQPTPTSAAGQPFHQTGNVTSVSSGTNSFTMQIQGGSTTYTIVVITSGSPKTEIQINGVAQTSLENLKTGMRADVEGQSRSDGSILAFSVDAGTGGGN